MLKTLLKVLKARLFCPFAGFLREVFDCVFNTLLKTFHKTPGLFQSVKLEF